MLMLILRGVIAGAIVVGATELSGRYPKMAALLLGLPIVSVLAFMATWHKNHDLPNIAKLSREKLILVPLGLPFFAPLAFADRMGFWLAMLLGLALAAVTTGFWLCLDR